MLDSMLSDWLRQAEDTHSLQSLEVARRGLDALAFSKEGQEGESGPCSMP